MRNYTVEYMMIGILILFALGFSLASFFLAKEIVRTTGGERKTALFRIEVALFITCLVGLLVSVISVVTQSFTIS